MSKKDDIKKAIKAGMEVDFAHIENKNNILGVNPHSCGALQVNMTSLLKKNLTYHIEGLCMVHIVITYSYHGKGNIESSSIGSLGSRKITPWRT